MASSWLKRFASSGQACRSCWRAAMRNCLRCRTSIYLGSANLTSRTSSPRKLQRGLGRSFPLGFETSKFEPITPAGICHRDARNFGRCLMTAVCAQQTAREADVADRAVDFTVEREAETDPGSAPGGAAVAVEWADLQMSVHL